MRISDIFTDHMVLQRDKNIKIYGDGNNGEVVTIAISSYTESVTVVDGKWMAEIGPMKAGGPYELVVCSEPNDVIDKSSDFCDTESDRIVLHDVYIGDVYLAGGQSNMELELQNSDNADVELVNANFDKIRFCNIPKLAKLDEYSPKPNWKICTSENARDVSAVAYYAAKKIHLATGVPIGIIGCYKGGSSITCWMNNETLGSLPEAMEYVREYDIKIGDKTEEEYDAEMAEYEEILAEYNEKVSIAKEHNPQITMEQLNEMVGNYPWPEPAGPTSPYRPGNLYYSMLERVIPYTIKAVWFYQGEEDTYKAMSYLKLFKAMISLWREKWQDNIPFIIHQLPMFIDKGVIDDRSWAVLRDMQRRASKEIDEVYLNVLIDLGEFDNIHPTDKLTVGNRLADVSLNNWYGKHIDISNPYPTKVYIDNDNVIVKFSDSYLDVRDNKHIINDIPLFELAGEDMVYYKALAKLDNDSIILACDNVLSPKYVRYAWVNYGEIKLFGSNGLPVQPFCLKI